MTDATQQDAAVLARWRAAEDKIYPLAMSDPDRYRQVLEAMRTLVVELRRTAKTQADLLAVEESPEALLGTLHGRTPLPAALMVKAACSARTREIAAEIEGERRAAVVAAARAEGRDWVVLEGPEEIGDLLEGRTVAVHLPSGRTLVTVVDPFSGEEPFQIAELSFDDQPGRDLAFAHRRDWLAEHDRWREEITSS